MESQIKRYRLLDAFRGLAILWIVCYHILATLKDQYGNVVSQIIGHGQLGVCIFFVISGFGLAASFQSSRNKNPLRLLLSRFQRIYLPFWWHLLFVGVLLPCLLALVSALKSHNFYIEFFSYSTKDWLQIITLTRVFTAPNWDLYKVFLPLNGVLWYLAIIAQIYIYLAISQISVKHNSAILLIGFVISLASNIDTVSLIIPYGSFIPFFAQFYIGVVTYHFIANRQDKSNAILGLIVIIVCIMAVIISATHYRHLLPLAFSSFIGALFFSLYKYDDALNKSLITKIFLVLGSCSFSIYLLHVPLATLIDMFIRNLTKLPQTWGAPLLLIPLLCISSFFWHLFFEKPSTQKEVFYNLLNPMRTLRAGLISIIKTIKGE